MASVAEEPRNGTKADGTPLDDLLNKQSVNRELMEMRMNNETIMAECRVRPRDMQAIKRNLEMLLNEFPEFADDAIYSKKVGSKKVGSEWEDTYAEDLSIRAAEALAEAYGFNRIRADVLPVDDDHVKVEATFTDFQSGRIWQDAGIVSKWYTASKDKGGGRVRYDDDRFHNTVAKAAKSKAIREVICRSVNPALKAWFKNECYKVMAKSLKPEDATKIVDAWKGLGVSLEKLEKLVGKPLAMGWMVGDQLKLRTLYVSVRDGETTIDALLAPVAAPADASQADIDAQIAAKNAAKAKGGKAATTKPMTDEERFEMEAKQ